MCAHLHVCVRVCAVCVCVCVPQASTGDDPPMSCRPDTVSHGYVSIKVPYPTGCCVAMAATSTMWPCGTSRRVRCIMGNGVCGGGCAWVCPARGEDSLCHHGQRTACTALSRVPRELVLLEVSGRHAHAREHALEHTHTRNRVRTHKHRQSHARMHSHTHCYQFYSTLFPHLLHSNNRCLTVLYCTLL